MDKTADFLKKLGFSEKETAVYLALLVLGPAPVRKIAAAAKVNRGTTHDALKSFQKQGLASYYHKEKHQYFTAENPAVVFENILKLQKSQLEEKEGELKDIIPQLSFLWAKAEEKPVVKYYQNYQGIRAILEDVLTSVKKEEIREYAVYSSLAIRPYLYKAFPNYNEERLKRKITVRAIAIGRGGREAGLDERRWLESEKIAPTYTLIYSGKTAMISVSKDIPHGTIIEDNSIYETQLFFFDWVWEHLKK